jgi:hypothetical protein
MVWSYLLPPPSYTQTGGPPLLIGKPKWYTPFRRSRLRREDNINMDLREMGFGVWTGFTWIRRETIAGFL